FLSTWLAVAAHSSRRPMPWSSRNRLRSLLTVSRLNFRYHIVDVPRLPRLFAHGGGHDVGPALLGPHGHDQALTEVLHRLEITGDVVMRDHRGQPAEHHVLARLG